ncbi:hypothetical protein [Pseudomonas sp.]|uniref:hypothetical protein n=1 Tax=Pseudomonas sp. TaxID=306 RepID=UPI002CA08A0F|nr:hypothetical protein [Pseudomonas sp.]HUE93960.1 hypothetical protein [Pseudomonas sp.]
MHDLLQRFFACCEAVLRGDAQMLDQLRAYGFTCEPGHWTFSLPELHRYLTAGQEVDYRLWRKQLFASDLNTRLRVLGAEIAILDNCGKVDASLYGLRCLRA